MVGEICLCVCEREVWTKEGVGGAAVLCVEKESSYCFCFVLEYV